MTTNPRYTVNINYQPNVANGWGDVSVGGVTHSTRTYVGNYYVASMPEVALYATGSSYTESLNNLLILASASSIQGLQPLSNVRTW